MINYNDYNTAMKNYSTDMFKNRVSSPTNEMCHKFNLDARKYLGFKDPIVKGDILICNRSSLIWPVLNGDRMLVEEVGDDFYISLLLPGDVSKTNVWLKRITVRSLETDVVFNPLVCMDYLLGIKPTLSKRISRALVANHKIIKNETNDQTASYLDPYLNPALFRYGYSQTGHKLQGSECETITMIVKSIEALKGSEFGRRYAYTTITRARKNVTIVEIPWF